MRYLNLCLLLLLTCFSAMPSFAQMTADPTTWKYEVKKKSATEYQLVFHVELKTGWHLWSVKPGGDGYQIPTSFKFDNNTGVKLKGSIAEKGKMITTAMEGIDGKVNYYAGNVDYIQNVTVAAGATRVTGKHTYQVCNDRMCLPPMDKDFVFDVTGK